MLVGEAPGEQEALEGRPFVGKAGRNLAGFLEALGLRRSEIYITNVVKVRPTRVSPAGRVVNRPPSREEKALFTPWLMREVAVVRPSRLNSRSRRLFYLASFKPKKLCPPLEHLPKT